MKVFQEIKSPLRYPGGKAKALAQLLPFIPKEYGEFREPFLGGGSVFIYHKQRYPDKTYWVNDLNYDLYCFWKVAKENLSELVEQIEFIKKTSEDGRILFDSIVAQLKDDLTELQRAIRFFVLNRITFSGTVDSGGYSQKAFESRFTDSSIHRLKQLRAVLENVEVSNLDYSELLYIDGQDVFIFLDPPYFTATKSRLYGKNGDLHLGFDHKKFAEHMKGCPHKWMITYDDCEEVRNNFADSHLFEWEFQYGMNNYKKDFAAKGKELIITNYPIQIKELSEQLVLV